ncbi:DEAD/DEAH box helicase [Candidatus Woesearchaeota archaeon]|jgi:ERCC4-related helicase|nr:DEAD/DEAH box helicase [Candidatus Woesearchaeota archaeon]MBT4835268.1 DEAD/DEAH box helicase [Candidatus Woesearchaeota archaeon]MBT6734745.1 DEAD/DEAH box helicase [Candidatus Woesearchaeota archaeon]MBT7474334.1 DEAD/DEAH box helicase [Candidatus Woesearchaeota archaeon]
MHNIKNFKPRRYQETILNTCTNKNTLVVLPTGLGKTKIAILTAITRLNQYPDSKILFLTPTKPLANQIYEEFKESTNVSEISLFTGAVPPKKRKELYETAKIIISTPQGIENDIINNSIDIKKISLLAIDEAHRAVKDYSYTWIAKQYRNNANSERIIGLTASPGSELETINEVCENLFSEEIELRTESDEDVKPYIHKTKVENIKVELPEDFKKIKKYLEDSFNSKKIKLKNKGYALTQNTKKEILNLQFLLQKQITKGEKDYEIFQSISLVAELLKINHAIEMLETQGLESLNNYLSPLFEKASMQKSKAVKNMIMDPNMVAAYQKTKLSIDMKIKHPKKIKLLEIIKKEISENPSIRIIIFNQYRDSAKSIENELNEIEDINAKLFVGQTKKNGTGLTQKKQIEIINDFEKNKYNCLVSTSIGEEGLDIPKVDLVIFYEPIPSAIRSIQRRGRTARHASGKLIVLITKNTRDEAYHWTAYHKEKRMHKVLQDIKNKRIEVKQPTLDKFIHEKEDLIIFADSREGGSRVIKKIKEMGVNIQLKTMTTADFVVSSRVAIERKTTRDFVDSIIDKRLLSQLKDLKQYYERPLIIIEGEEDIYSVRKIHPNAIRGMLSTIAISYGIPILHTKSPGETAELIKSIAKKEQNYVKKDFGIRVDKKPLTTKEQQEFIIESLPGIGPSLAKSLLNKFGSVEKIINADQKNLINIDQLGEKKAEEIIKIIKEEY